MQWACRDAHRVIMVVCHTLLMMCCQRCHGKAASQHQGLARSAGEWHFGGLLHAPAEGTSAPPQEASKHLQGGQQELVASSMVSHSCCEPGSIKVDWCGELGDHHSRSLPSASAPRPRPGFVPLVGLPRDGSQRAGQWQCRCAGGTLTLTNIGNCAAQSSAWCRLGLTLWRAVLQSVRDAGTRSPRFSSWLTSAEALAACLGIPVLFPGAEVQCPCQSCQQQGACPHRRATCC